MSKKANQENAQKGSFQAKKPSDVKVGSFGGAFKKGANARPGEAYESHGGNGKADPDRRFN